MTKSKNAIFCRCGDYAKIVDYDDDCIKKLLQDPLTIVQMPWLDNVAVIRYPNEEVAKMSLNRGLMNGPASPQDIVFGDFAIIGIKDEKPCALTKHQSQQYLSLHLYPCGYMFPLSEDSKGTIFTYTPLDKSI